MPWQHPTCRMQDTSDDTHTLHAQAATRGDSRVIAGSIAAWPARVAQKPIQGGLKGRRDGDPLLLALRPDLAGALCTVLRL
eukprot:15254775-Alexandrium_andersonii.AAC.1